MAVMDLYRSLTEEQQARLRACRSLPELEAVIRAEGIALTEEHLEAIYGSFGFEGKKQRANAIETGMFGRYIVPSEEWHELLSEAEANERAIRSRYPSVSEQEAAACELIAGENELLWLKLLTAKDIQSFLNDCLTLRGSFREARQRRLAREQARLLGYLAEGAPLPKSGDGVLSLWETANRLEPRAADDLPAHFRTPDEHVPFAHKRNPLVPGPVPAGGRRKSRKRFHAWWNGFKNGIFRGSWPRLRRISCWFGSIRFQTATDIPLACFAAECLPRSILLQRLPRLSICCLRTGAACMMPSSWPRCQTAICVRNAAH